METVAILLVIISTTLILRQLIGLVLDRLSQNEENPPFLGMLGLCGVILGLYLLD